MELRKFLALLSLSLLAVLMVAAWFFPLDEDFRVENPFWNGAMSASKTGTILPLNSLDGLAGLPRNAGLLLVPYMDFTTGELDALAGFIEKGGTLLLADDYGYGNRVLEHLGLSARFSGKALLDPLANYRNKWFPRIFNFRSDSLAAGTSGLVLNHATYLESVTPDETVARSSLFSFADLNGIGEWEAGEPTGPLPVVSRHNLGQGGIILLADPSIVINSMEGMEDNRDFIQNVAATVSAFYIDQSHLPPSNLHQTKSLLASLRNIMVTPLGTLGLVMAALAITLAPIWYERRQDDISG
ncbi:MAG: hypothetical protein HYX91_01645 [Chloroflexi bacterium]|nr:hypothetical protein [Chloroflexota bacterium]